MSKSIDPQWAWAPYEPTGDQWNHRTAAHLFRRAGFGASVEQIESALKSTPAETVRKLVRERSETSQYQQMLESLKTTILATGDVKNLPAWWTYRFLTTPDVLQEKMTLFWHGHFATSGDKVTEPRLMSQQNEVLRQHALGDFAALVHDISRDPAMLIYLDSVSNRKAHPNENFARELMELFCLGEGNYTEQDIRELSRCFTGWEIRNDQFRFNRYQHDDGVKQFLGQSGTFSGDDGVDIVLAQESAPYFIAHKLVRYFVFDEPQPSTELLEPLARQLRENGFQMGDLVERILGSNLFFSEHSIARKIRSPVEFVIGLLRSLEGSTDMYALANGLRELGQTPFFPPNVKGWDGGRTWVNSSTLLARANLVRSLLDRKETRFADGTLSELHDRLKQRSGLDIVDFWQTHLLAVSIPDDVRTRIANSIEASRGSREERLREALHQFCTLPEFQLG